MNEVTLKFLNLSKFTTFLNKFKLFDNNLLISFVNSEEIVSKAFNSQKTAVKMARMDINEIFEIDDNSKLPNDLRFIIYNIDRLVQIFNAVGENNEINIIIKYEKDKRDKDVYYVNSFKILTKNLSNQIPCGEKMLVPYMDDTTADFLFDTKESFFKLDLDKDFLNKVILFAKLDFSDSIKITSIIDDTKKLVIFSGRNFDLKFEGETEIYNEFEISVKKEYFQYLDKDEYTLYAKVVKKEEANINTEAIVFEDKNDIFKIILSSANEE